MKRATVLLVAAGILLAAGPARGDQTWTQNQHATNLATGAKFSLDGLPAPVLGKFSPLRLDDLTLCAGGPLWVNATGLPFRCATIGNTASGADLQAPLAPADGSIVMPTAGTIRVGTVPGTGVTGTPNTAAWFNGSGVLNSLTLAPEFGSIVGGTLSIAAGGITTVKLADAAVTYAKIQNVGAGKLLGNPTGSPAPPSEIAPDGTSIGFSGTTLQRQALAGAITAAAGSNTTAFGLAGPYSALMNPTGGSAVPSFVGPATAGQFLGQAGWASVPGASVTGPASTAAYFTGAGALSGAADQVANIAALEALPASSYRDGARVRVTSLNDDFFFHTTSALTVDDITVASASGASGSRWIRREGGRRADWATAYWVDAAAGNDQNAGTSSGTPIKTGAELARRLTGLDLSSVVTVNVVSDMPDSDPIVLNTSTVNSLNILGAPTVVTSGLIASAVAANYGSSQLNQITITGFNWAPYVGTLVRLQGTSGPSGTYAIVVHDAGSGTALLGPQVVSNSVFGATSFSAGQTIEVLSYPKVPGISVVGARPTRVTATELRIASATTISLNSSSLGTTLALTRCVIDGGGTVTLSSTFGTLSLFASSIRSTTGISVAGLTVTNGSAMVNNGQASVTALTGSNQIIWRDTMLWASRVNFGEYADVVFASQSSPGIGVGVFGLSSGQVGLQFGRESQVEGTPIGGSNDPASYAIGLSRTTRFYSGAPTGAADTSSAGALVGYTAPTAPASSGGQAIPLVDLAFQVVSLNNVSLSRGPDVASTTNLSPLGLTAFRSWVITGSTPIASLTMTINLGSGLPSIPVGTVVEFLIHDGVQFVNTVSAPVGFGQLLLADGANETLPAGARIRFEFIGGSTWQETWRSTVGGVLTGSMPNPGLVNFGPGAVTSGGVGIASITTDATGRVASVATATYLRDPGANGIVVRTASGTTTSGQLSGVVSTSGTSLTTTLNLGAAGVSGQLPCASNSTWTGDVTNSGCTTTLANIPNATTVAGAENFTAIAAPGTPGTGHGNGWFDSTSLTWMLKNAAGTVSHLAQSKTCATHTWMSLEADTGAFTCTQPDYADLTGTPAGAPPTGAAGGALTGTYPNPSIATGVIVGANFANFPADTLFGNPTGSPAAPTTIPLGTGLSFVGSALTVTVAGGADALGTYWVSSATHAPANAVNWGLLGNGVHQQTTSGSVATPGVFTSTPQALVFGAATGGGLATDTNFSINPSTHFFTATGSVSLQGATTTIGAWNGVGTYVGGVVGAFSVGGNLIPYGSGAGGGLTQSTNLSYPGGALTITSADSNGNGLYLNRSGTQQITRHGGIMWQGTDDLNPIQYFVNNSSVIGGWNTGGSFFVQNMAGVGTRCAHVDSAGVFSPTASDCGSGGGSVTGVTASAPLASSGGTAPNITLTYGNGLSNVSGTLSNDLHTGVSGGQSVVGGNASGNALTLTSNTSHDGNIFLGISGTVGVLNELGRAAFGQTTVDAAFHVALSNNSGTAPAPLGTTAWDSKWAVFGAQGSTGGALGISRSTGGQVYVSALAPNVAWQELYIGAHDFQFYSDGLTAGFFQDSSGHVGVATLNAGGVVVAAPGTGQFSVSPALVASLYYTTRLYTLLNGGELVQGGYSLNPLGAISFTQVEYPANIAASHVTLTCNYEHATVTGGTYVFRPARNGVDTSIGVSITPGTSPGVYTTSTTVSSPATTDSWGLDVTSVGTASNCDPSTSNCPDILCSILLTP